MNRSIKGTHTIHTLYMYSPIPLAFTSTSTAPDKSLFKELIFDVFLIAMM